MPDTNTTQAGYYTILTIAPEVRFPLFFNPATRSSRPFSVPTASEEDITCVRLPGIRLQACASGHPPGIRLWASATKVLSWFLGGRSITFQLPCRRDVGPQSKPFVACLWLLLVWVGAGASGGGVLGAGWLGMFLFSFFLGRPPTRGPAFQQVFLPVVVLELWFLLTEATSRRDTLWCTS